MIVDKWVGGWIGEWIDDAWMVMDGLMVDG